MPCAALRRRNSSRAGAGAAASTLDSMLVSVTLLLEARFSMA